MQLECYHSGKMAKQNDSLLPLVHFDMKLMPIIVIS